MVYGFISKQGKTELYFKPEKLAITSAVYIDILNKILIPFAK
jgi:hypothetical protein